MNLLYNGGMKTPIPAVYKIQNMQDGKVYIGSSENVVRRIYDHKRWLKGGYHVCQKLQYAYDIAGPEAFVYTVLEEIFDISSLHEREQYWIDLLDAANIGYNTSPTAGSISGMKMTEETREKMSKSATGHIKSDEHRANLSVANTGKKMSDESRMKMRLAKLGKKRPPHTPETKAKMSAAKIGQVFSDETRQKMAIAKKGRTLSDETRKKMSESHQRRLSK